MNKHVALQARLSDVVDEYDRKQSDMVDQVAAFEAAGNALKEAASIGGMYGQQTINTGSIYERDLRKNLLVSAWKHVYEGLNIARIASARDKSRFEQKLADPAPFTLENIREEFGKYLLDPRGNILRALAEVFCDLDPAFKSHDKVKIGVAKLPKRVILSNVSDYGWGRDRLVNILNALAAVQNLPLVEYNEVSALLKDEDAMMTGGSKPLGYRGEPVLTFARGIRLRRFGNGNGHLFFEPDTLRDVNMALAEYYGDVLPDTTDEKPVKKAASTAVSKDLQYYPTPAKVIERVIAELYQVRGKRFLEPSCGDGRIMDALRKAGAKVTGIEVDVARASAARAKGHNVVTANFLGLPTGFVYDAVLMNPPFYGKHYAKHVEHALKFLKPGGVLTAILPASARHDHGLLDHMGGRWEDLPVGSFSESGTNINTVVLTVKKREG